MAGSSPLGDAEDFNRRARENQAQLTANLKPAYDFIVCGAGASGSVIVRRLARGSAADRASMSWSGRDAGACGASSGQGDATVRVFMHYALLHAMNNDAVERLELKITFLEKANAELSDVVLAQQRQIDALQARLTQLVSRMEASRDSERAYTLEEEKPPHY